MALPGSLLGRALDHNCCIWISDCTLHLQHARNVVIDLVRACVRGGTGMAGVCVGGRVVHTERGRGPGVCMHAWAGRRGGGRGGVHV